MDFVNRTHRFIQNSIETACLEKVRCGAYSISGGFRTQKQPPACLGDGFSVLTANGSYLDNVNFRVSVIARRAVCAEAIPKSLKRGVLAHRHQAKGDVVLGGAAGDVRRLSNNLGQRPDWT
jgi:hypothetical protein